MERFNYRAYIKSSGEVLPVYGVNKDKVFIDSLDSPEHGKNIFDADDCILLRYTGFQDKNGNDIYEFDVLAEYGVVRFLNGSWVAGQIGSLVYLYAVHEESQIIGMSEPY